MIAVSSSGKSFRALAAYLATGRSGEEHERVAWSAGRNLPTDDPELAATFMRATAAQSDRVEKPVYHIALSFDPSDPVDRAAMEQVANHLLERLGLAEHQAVIVAHRDREHPHLHLLVNRVHPETGLAWERWKDQPLIQQVLREEEQALGLREVPGTLTPQQDRSQDGREKQRVHDASGQAAPERSQADTGREQQERERQAEQRQPQQLPPRITRVDELAQHLGTHERVVELTREHYLAQIDVSAARARVTQLDAAAERARGAMATFEAALGAVYRDPDHAYRTYLAVVERQGVTAATQAMRERPEQFGTLATVERPRAFGLVRGEDDSPARTAAPLAAVRGRDAIEALRGFWKVAADMQARRLEHAFTRALGAVYQEPVAARTAFERLAAERGAEPAATTLRERPEELGAIRPPLRDDPARREELRTHAAVAADLGIEAGKARAFATVAGERVREPRPEAPEAERAASRKEAERAGTREAAVRAELRTLPERAALERRIANLIDRMSPHEVRQFRRVVTAPRFAVAMELRTTIRDVALGRDEERSHSR
jgi:hypothetical protein